MDNESSSSLLFFGHKDKYFLAIESHPKAKFHYIFHEFTMNSPYCNRCPGRGPSRPPRAGHDAGKPPPRRNLSVHISLTPISPIIIIITLCEKIDIITDYLYEKYETTSTFKSGQICKKIL